MRDLFDQAIKDNGMDVDTILKTRRYQRLRELWYTSFLALAMKKSLKKEYYLSEPESDSPDILFLDIVKGEAFGVEVMELFFYDQPIFDGNYATLAKTIWDKKGTKDLKYDHLLVISRIDAESFNLTKLVKEIKEFDRKNVERIWFGVYRGESSLNWKFFEIYALGYFDDTANISFSLNDKEDMKYRY